MTQICKIYLRRDQNISLRERYSSNKVKVFAPQWVHNGILQLSGYIKGMECSVYDNASRTAQAKKPEANYLHHHHAQNTFIFGEEIEKNPLLALQKIARNEPVNVSGDLNKRVYQGVNENVKLSIRDLVRQCVIAGVDYSSLCGGYRCPKESQERQKVYICDLAALQFQLEHNTGRLVLIYQDNTMNQGLLDDMIFQNVVGEKKRSFEEIPHVTKGKKRQRYIYIEGQQGKSSPCYIDSLAYRRFVREDVILFGLAICKIVKEFHPNDKIHLKFLKYGTGFFAGRFGNILEDNILPGVLDGLELLLAQTITFGIIARVELPFYNTDPESTKRIEMMKESFKVGIIVTNNDALKQSDKKRLFIATSNCGDNHAPCGNEMGYSSVDAAIAENLESKGNLFCPNINLKMGEEYIQMPESEIISKTRKDATTVPATKSKKVPTKGKKTGEKVKKQLQTESTFVQQHNPGQSLQQSQPPPPPPPIQHSQQYQMQYQPNNIASTSHSSNADFDRCLDLLTNVTFTNEQYQRLNQTLHIKWSEVAPQPTNKKGKKQNNMQINDCNIL